MTTRRISAALIIATAVLWIAWDLVAVHTPGGTESETIRWWAEHHLILPFALGVLMGHFFGIQWRAPND